MFSYCFTVYFNQNNVTIALIVLYDAELFYHRMIHNSEIPFSYDHTDNNCDVTLFVL